MAICFMFFPTGEWLKYTIVLIPLVMLDWKDRDKQCSLTSLEAKIRGTWTLTVMTKILNFSDLTK